MSLAKFKFTEDELKTLIKDHDKYFAHLPKDKRTSETLIDHILLVQKYFFKIIEVHNLEPIITNLIKSLTAKKNIQTYIAELFVKSIAIHDFGKVNSLFQKEKMKNDIGDDISHNLSSAHSIISAYIYVLYSELILKDKVVKEDEIFIDLIVLAFSYPILMHHSPILRSISDVEKYKNNLEDLKKFISKFWNLENNTFIEEINNYIVSNTQGIINQIDKQVQDSFSLFALVKLLFSLLTASDYYATTHFMSNWETIFEDFGVLNSTLKDKIFRSIETTKDYNKEIYTSIKENYNLAFPKKQSLLNLNILRKNLAIEIIKEIQKNKDRNLFYIEAPTGSGKTNLSMLALAELLQNDLNIDNDLNNIDKVFYVFPFTTLIEQTFASLKETLNLNNNEIAQIHSKASFSEKDDDFYGDKSKNIIDYLFMNYPIALISHVKFFDILKSNDKSTNYLLHRLANSLVIIDELQAYPPKEWDKVIYFIEKYSKAFNIKFILMSATLPKIDNLLLGDKSKGQFVYLVKDKNKYFQNPNFKNRVEIKYDYLSSNDFKQKEKDDFFKILWRKILEESQEYKDKHGKVHTIIEFIFNKTASEFVQFIENNNSLFHEIFLLSGTILEPRRKEVIAKLKSKSYKNKNILLITTQVVEAGVDIDMDIGFKDTSLIDSDEQLAGRINRNISKTECKLFLFNLDDASKIYSKDYRHKLFKDFNIRKEILESKNFDKLYKEVIKYKKKINQSSDMINFTDYLKSVKNLNFNKVNNDFKLIDNSTISVFVPIKHKVKINISDIESLELFTKEEIDFLKSKRIKVDDYINGEDIWKIYCELIENKQIDFIKKKAELLILQGLMSKFIFSVMINSKNYKALIDSGNCEEKYGFLYILNSENIYDITKGILKSEYPFIW